MVSILKTDKIQASHGSTIEIPTGNVLNAPGHVIQAVQLHAPGNVGTSSSGIISTTSTSFVDFISKDITTKLANSLIYVKTYSLYYAAATVYGDGRMLRDSTIIDECKYQFYSDPTGTFTPFGFQLLDSPNAAAGTTITYKQQVKRTSQGTIAAGYGDSGGKVNTNMILMEIAQ